MRDTPASPKVPDGWPRADDSWEDEAMSDAACGSLHLRYFERHVPDPERVKSAHTRMTAADFAADLPHREYCQSDTEGCYLCALLYEIEELKQENRRLREVVG